MATKLTDTGVTFNDGSIQATAADQLLLRSTISSAVSTYEYTGWYNANLRNIYQGIRIDISDIIAASASPNNDYCLQFRWTDGTGTYGWATSSGTPYRYPNLRLVLSQSSIDRYSDVNSDKILIGHGHGQLSGSVKILGIQDFNNSCIFSCYGTHTNGHKFTSGGAKIENLSGEVRVIDGFRLFIAGGATINSGVVSTYGIRR